MDEELMKLAKECGIRINKADDQHLHTISNDLLEAFYREAFNAGLEAAANAVKHDCDCGCPCDCYSPATARFQIRALERK